MGAIPEYLRHISVQTVVVRFIVAALCSGIIGISRGKKHHAAGFRTHLLVCVGAASVMMINQYTYEYLGYGGDIGRMGAQVVSGIGFLGAGTILVTGKKHIKGLTSAAGLWASACMGLAVGIGFYEAAAVMCVVLFIILSAFEKVDELYIKTAREFTVYTEFDSSMPLSCIIREIKKDDCRVCSLEKVETKANNINSVIIVIETKNSSEEKLAVVNGIKQLEGVVFVEEI